MSTSAAVEALARHNQERSQVKKNAVLTAVARLTEDSSARITKSAVARHAGVSREFINSHSDLKRFIDDAARAQLQRQSAPPSRSSNNELGGLRAQNRTFADTIAHQKNTIAELRATIERLRHQRQLHLGAQLAATVVEPDSRRCLQQDHDRLLSETHELRIRLDEQQRCIDDLSDDLAASRQAHANAVADQQQAARQSATIVALTANRPTEAHDR